MSRLFYSRPDSVDEEIIHWLSFEINVAELGKKKAAIQILNQDVIPNLQNLLARLNAEKISHLINCDILDKNSYQLLPLGKGYLFNLILDLI